MMFILLLAACVTLCYGHVIPMVPGDNSHFVDGESRYVWMPNGEGKPVLVDLEEPVNEELFNTKNGANNQYWLFTRQNQIHPQVIVNGNANSIRNSNYVANRPLYAIVHGWDSSGHSEMNPLITSAILAVQDANVIVVDWNNLANEPYTIAARGVPSVGQFLGNFITWVINTAGGNWNQVHFIGFSLGAHVVGNAGRQTGSRPARITGLDPAGLTFEGSSNAIRRTDGQYVEIIHTDGARLGLGILTPSGDADFYPNGGKSPQPGCSTVLGNVCSHGRAPEFCAVTVRHNHLVGRQCTNLQQAENQNCSGASLHMGNAIMNKRGAGLYGLRTGNSWPF